ncbi:ATP-grasp domain-containing protein [Streptomyces albireticuli]|uniref:Carboxylase n=1 Tax=Streptomyces albireticuli TaxID=1940 RepID=A0A2A2D7D6_9ACTN|nr:ATP-grasp domain-containing protein [Streptomyces albireticuli]MCD9145114.1 ATP-grasp domain-containing protein [Streptomyces albireticuli]MCD9164711.1 ATP-grasp domain-containing protein [Streptomyces albireticuli]MCD9194976.1 ATP-grasp domain-containing protein [Streptomyces albireticuli]PAU47425.1 carboxylase [Streptomyces albireticuli]
MKKVLLIEANVYAGEDLLTAAADLGYRVHVATHEDLYDQYRPELKERIAGTVFTDFSDAGTAVADLTAFCRAEGIDGVVTSWEFLSPLATRVAAALGLPGHAPEFADACRNKRLMAEVFDAHGVAAPRTVTAPDHEALALRIKESGLSFPLVVKPAENAGSIGVSVVRSEAGLPAAAALAQQQTHEFPHGIALDTTLLAQEYVDGDEFSIETIVSGGVAHHLAVTEKFTTDDASRAETGHTVPAELAAPDQEAVLAVVSAAIAALGLRDGVAHTEVKLDSRGNAKIIEIGARPPGDNIMKLVSEALGVSEARAYLQAAVGERPDVTPTRTGAAAIRFFTAPHAGTFRRIDGIPEAGHVVASSVYKQPGDEVGGPTDNIGRIGHVILRGDTAAETNKAALEILNGVTVEMETAR